MSGTTMSLYSPPVVPLSEIASAITTVRAMQEPGTTRREWRLAEELGPAFRATCERRLNEIKALLRPASTNDIAAHIGTLYIAMVPRRWSPEEATAALKLYVTDLSGLPRVALENACARYRRGDVGDGHFMPTAAELRREAKRAIEPIAVEKLDLEALLAARVAKPADPDRHAMRSAFLALAGELRVAPPPRYERPSRGACEGASAKPKTFEEIVESYRENPASLSDEALRITRPSTKQWNWREAA